MKKDIHHAFIIWESLRSQNVPEYYINIRLLLKVRSPAGLSKEFEVAVGVHRGSALSPLIFITHVIINYLTTNLQREPPWDLLYADDIVLIRDSAEDLEEALVNWRHALETAGFKINRQKTEYNMQYCYGSNNQDRTIHIQNHPLNTGWMK
ncbi:uncharacterized protein LOC123696196 [Colias croceus]|uniref:uncharacterized protein LOC123696196 n=1 Tax=Colias crocea TaxID=72248 RepID=UPI001E280D17|nr:uncharacterized protein LOC123696196 [Colias croceus]